MILILEQTGLGKQCRPRSDDSSINILIGVDSFCHSIYIFWNVLLFSEIKIFRMSVFFQISTVYCFQSVLGFGLLETPGTSDEPETTFSSRGSCSSSSLATGPTPKAQGKQLWSSTIGSSSQSGLSSSSRAGAASCSGVGSSSKAGRLYSTVGSSGTVGVSNYSTLTSG